MIGGALLLTPVITLIEHSPYAMMLRCMPFFLLGARYPALVLQMGALATGRKLAIALAVFALVCTIFYRSDAFMNPVTGLAGIWLGVLASALVVRHLGWLRGPAKWLAARTLPIYVMHFPMLTIIGVSAGPLAEAMADNTAFAIAFPPLMTAATIALCLGVHRLLLALHAGWLFNLPGIPVLRLRQAPLPR